MEKSNFINAYLKTNGHEGGYVNNPADNGGETYRGIARKFWPKWKGWAFVDILKEKYSGAKLDARLASNAGVQAMVEEFYLDNFWMKSQLYEFDQNIADEIYDTSVNQGRKTAIIYFQKALNILNRNQRDYQDIEVDGQIGLNTLLAYDAYMATEQFSSRTYLQLIATLLKVLNYYQLERYIDIANRDKIQELFVMGWVARV